MFYSSWHQFPQLAPLSPQHVSSSCFLYKTEKLSKVAKTKQTKHSSDQPKVKLRPNIQTQLKGTKDAPGRLLTFGLGLGRVGVLRYFQVSFLRSGISGNSWVFSGISGYIGWILEVESQILKFFNIYRGLPNTQSCLRIPEMSVNTRNFEFTRNIGLPNDFEN